MLLLKKSRSMIVHPLVPALDRTLLTSPVAENQQVPPQDSPPVFTFTLKRSGRVIRKVEGAPPSFARDWNLPLSSSSANNTSGLPRLVGTRLAAELLHVCQPLTHLLVSMLMPISGGRALWSLERREGSLISKNCSAWLSWALRERSHQQVFQNFVPPPPPARSAQVVNPP